MSRPAESARANGSVPALESAPTRHVEFINDNPTIDICDAVQWVLNYADIRLLYLTAADDLGIRGAWYAARALFS